MDPWNNIIKESAEEAGIPADLVVKKAKSSGAVTYYTHSDTRGNLPCTEYIYDLELPSNFVPQPADGEVEEFYLWDWSEIKQRLIAKEFTYEAGLVVIDFWIRHGIITVDCEPGFSDLFSSCHQPLPFPSPTFW